MRLANFLCGNEAKPRYGSGWKSRAISQWLWTLRVRYGPIVSFVLK